MKIHFLKLKNWLLVTLMGALGLTSCQCHKKMAEPQDQPKPAVREREEMRLMYGVPTMNYMIRGQVENAKGRPVKDIRVNMLERGMEATADTLYGDPERVKDWLEQTGVATDKKGRFTLEGRGVPQDEVRLLVRDVDGKKNGKYRNQLVEVKVDAEHVNRDDADGWYQGTFNKEVKVRLESGE